MNVLIAIYHGIGKGGAEISVKILAEQLRKRGHNIIIASSEDYGGFCCERFAKFRKWPFFVLKTAYLKHFLRKVMKKYNIDEIYAQDMYTTLAAIQAAKDENKKVFVHLRDYWLFCPRSSCVMPNYTQCSICSISKLFKCSRLRFPWELSKFMMIRKCWKSLNYSACIFVFGNYEKSLLRKLGVEARIVPVQNARDFSDMPSKESAKLLRKQLQLTKTVVTFCGSLTYTKGVTFLLEIIPLILKKTKEIQFVIAGDGPYKSDVDKLSKLFPKQVISLGWVNHEKIPVLLCASDIVLLPAIWREPFGAVQLEAAAAKKVVIGADVGGVRDGIFGMHIPIQDKDKWVDAIFKLAINKKLRGKLAAESYLKAKSKYDITPYADKIDKELR